MQSVGVNGKVMHGHRRGVKNGSLKTSDRPQAKTHGWLKNAWESKRALVEGCNGQRAKQRNAQRR